MNNRWLGSRGLFLWWSLSGLLAVPAAVAQPKDKPVKSTQSANVTKAARYRADLRAEANASTLSKQEYARVREALARRKAQEDREIAAYQQYQFEQRLALAEASAPKMYLYTGVDPTELSAAQEPSGSPRLSARTVAFGGQRKAMVRPARERATEPVDRDFKRYPDRFYRRTAQEAGFDRQDATLDTQQAREDAKALLESIAPFGVPVPGRPGLMTSPPSRFQGYIDVRGNQAGSVVVDPFTGERVRVPGIVPE